MNNDHNHYVQIFWILTFLYNSGVTDGIQKGNGTPEKKRPHPPMLLSLIKSITLIKGVTVQASLNGIIYLFIWPCGQAVYLDSWFIMLVLIQHDKNTEILV